MYFLLPMLTHIHTHTYIHTRSRLLELTEMCLHWVWDWGDYNGRRMNGSTVFLLLFRLNCNKSSIHWLCPQLHYQFMSIAHSISQHFLNFTISLQLPGCVLCVLLFFGSIWIGFFFLIFNFLRYALFKWNKSLKNKRVFFLNWK